MARPRIQHVSIPRPPGSERETRAFYGELLGFREIPVPESIRHLDLIWFQIAEQELHVFTEEPEGDTSGRHLCLEVEDLEGIRARLERARYRIEDPIPIPGRPRFFCYDPFGNRIEFTRLEQDS